MEKENRKSIIELAYAMAEAEFIRDNPSTITQWKDISSFSKKMKIQNFIIHARIALSFAISKFEKGMHKGFNNGYFRGNEFCLNSEENNDPIDESFIHGSMIDENLLPCDHSLMLPELRSIDGNYGERCYICQKTDKEIMDEERYYEREEIPYFCENCSNVLTTVCITLDNKFVCTNCFKNK